jgi:hypothetical protein
VNFAASSGGITSLNGLTGPSLSLNGGTGVTVTPNIPFTNYINISIGQPVATSSNVTFQSVQSQNVGTSFTFENTNGLFTVNGNGAITGATISLANTGTSVIFSNGGITGGSFNTALGGSYSVATVVVINSSRQFVGPGVNVGPSNGVAGRGFNPYDAGGINHTGQDLTFQDNLGFNHLVVGGVIVS